MRNQIHAMSNSKLSRVPIPCHMTVTRFPLIVLAFLTPN